MKFYYNPLDKKCKSIIGGVEQNQTITFNIYSDSFEPCYFVFFKDGEQARFVNMQKCDFGYTLSITMSDIGLYFYYFQLNTCRFGMNYVTRSTEIQDNSNYYQLTIYKKGYKTPDWFKGGIMYQIFPDRFYKKDEYPIKDGKILRQDWGGTPYYKPNEKGEVLNNDFFGGNFKGICEKLNYLKSLNVSVIYLNPIFEAYSNHRYDTANYLKVDSLLGSKQDFKELVDKAKEFDIKIILDGVFNHTGADSVYFNKYGNYNSIGAYQSKESKYYDWYTFENYPDKYDCWWGIKILPAVNEKSESYVEYITGKDGVLSYWQNLGVAGYRLDVADELPAEFIRHIRSRVKENDDEALLIGEVWEDASNKISYGVRRNYLQGEELDSVMNYPLKNGIINFVRSGNTLELKTAIDMLIDNYPKCVLDSLMNILGTHDTPRILTVLGGNDIYNNDIYNKDDQSVAKLTKEQYISAVNKLKICALLEYTLFGVPCVYYGDETGMEGYSDPFCRRCLDWNNIDFEINDFYKRLGEIRNNDIFIDGEYKEVFSSSNCLVYSRIKNNKKIYVFVNLGKTTYNVNFDGILYEILSKKVYNNSYEIKPNSYGILYDEVI